MFSLSLPTYDELQLQCNFTVLFELKKLLAAKVNLHMTLTVKYTWKLQY